MFPNMMDAMLAVKRRLCIYCFAIESQKFRTNRDLNLWSSPIPHLTCEFVTIFPVNSMAAWMLLPTNIVHPLSESSALRRHFLTLTEICYGAHGHYPSILSICSHFFHLDPVSTWFPSADSLPFTILLSPFRFNPYIWLFIKGSGLEACQWPFPFQTPWVASLSLPNPPPFTSEISGKHPLPFSVLVST